MHQKTGVLTELSAVGKNKKLWVFKMIKNEGLLYSIAYYSLISKNLQRALYLLSKWQVTNDLPCL